MDNYQDYQTEAKVVADLTAAAIEVRNVGEVPFVVVPRSHEVHHLEYMLPTPTRKLGKVVMMDAASFIDYFNTHKVQGFSRIYGTVEPSKFIGVLNDSSQDEAGWRDHTVAYACPLSKEWQEWKKNNDQGRDQLSFADFIETHVQDIVSVDADEPSGADMLQVANTFKAQKKVNFASAVRLDNGQVDFTYQEEIQGSAGAKGQIKVPERFYIGVPIFEGGSPYKIEAKLRYRLNDGKLTMWYELVRDHKVVEAAFMDVWKGIEEGTATKIWRGQPQPNQ